MLGFLFSQVEVEEIKGIVVPIFDEEDTWCWHYSKDGRYTVRSAYRMLLKEEIVTRLPRQQRKGTLIGI